ncbi:MAG: LysM domain-containing protein [Desulfobacterales bacterium]|nr:LysM domain-containing protein [Desulfobacterales bacterium]
MRYQNLIRISLCLCISTAMLWAAPSSPVAEEAPKEFPHESGMYYTIQKGDTLWDLSKRFFDSPDQWPDLWNQNDQIPNPHWIYPGERIRLFRQEGVEKIKEPEKVIEQAKQEEEKKVEAVKAAPPPPPPKEPPYYYYTQIEKVGFIRKDPVNPSGTIFRSQDDKAMISQGDEVYIRPAEHTILYPGATYTAYRNVEGIRGKKYSELVDSHGTQHYFTGVVEIIKQDADYYVARVVRSHRDIRINDLLMPHIPRSPKIILSESREGVLGQILVNEDRDRMFGDNTIAFIDKGKKDGIQAGQTYSVFYEDKHGLKFYKEGELLKPTASMEPVNTPIDFAKILVLLTEETTSTVLVTYSEKDLYPTARIRTPAR